MSAAAFAPSNTAQVKGEAAAQYASALALLRGGETSEAVTLIRRAAESGLPMAQYRLAKLYEHGRGVRADLSEARRWTERAAAAGNIRAMHDLGVYCARGEGGGQDQEAAARWFRQAAEFNVADSQHNLAVLYEQGRGVRANAAEALFWLLVAARQGDDDALRIAALEARLSPLEIEQARGRAQAFRPRPEAPAANDFRDPNGIAQSGLS